jgi:hypothetical protein
MFERTRGLSVVLSVLSIFYSAEAAVVTLMDGSAYSGLEVLEFDSEKEAFQIARNGTQISIRASEVSTIDFQNRLGIVALREGSSYPNLEILQFDFPQDRLTVRKSKKVLNLPLSEISQVKIAPFESRDSTHRVEATIGADGTSNPPTTEGANEPADAWKEDGLYSNLPDDFGEKKLTGSGDDMSGAGYTPRWTTESGTKAGEKKKVETPEKREPRKSLSSRKENSRERSTREKRRQARSASERRSSGSSRESGRSRRSLFDSGVEGLENETSFR